MRILFTAVLVFLSPPVLFSQNVIEGLVRSAEKFEVVEGAHIVNISIGKLAFTDDFGNFYLPGRLGDTLNVSHVGFKSQQIIVNHFDLKIIELIPEFVKLEEVRVTNLPESANQFKRELLDQGLIEIDSFIPFGVKPGKPKGEIPKLYERESKINFGANENFDPTLTIPISYFTKKFSKKHKAKRDYYELKAEKGQRIRNEKKYSKELVTRLVGLQDEALMNFMSFMNLQEDFITSATEYEIAKKILDSFEEFKSKSVSE